MVGPQRETTGTPSGVRLSRANPRAAADALGPPFATGRRDSLHGHCMPSAKQASSCTYISSRGTKAFRDAPAKEPVDRDDSVRGLFFAVEQVNEAVRAQQRAVRAAPSNTS